MKIEIKYSVPPYMAIRYQKKAQNIVAKLIGSGSSFLKPYTEAKAVLEIAMSLIDNSIELFEEQEAEK